MHSLKFRRFLKCIHYCSRGANAPHVFKWSHFEFYCLFYFILFHLLYYNDLFNQFEYTQDVLTVQAGRWRPVMLRPVMLTDLIKHNTSLHYDRLRSPDVLINFINQFKCTYKVLTVPARRWRPVMLTVTDSIKQYTILSYDRSRSPYTSLVRTGSLSLPFG